MDHKREDRTPPLARVMGVGRQQQHDNLTCRPLIPRDLTTSLRTKMMCQIDCQEDNKLVCFHPNYHSD